MKFKRFLLWNDTRARFISLCFSFIKWSIIETYSGKLELRKICLVKESSRFLMLEQKKSKDGTKLLTNSCGYNLKGCQSNCHVRGGWRKWSPVILGDREWALVRLGGGQAHCPEPTPFTNSQVMSLRRKLKELKQRQQNICFLWGWWVSKKNEKWVRMMSEKMLLGLASTVSTLHHTLLEAFLFWILSLSSSVSPIIFLSPLVSITSFDGCSNLVS